MKIVTVKEVLGRLNITRARLYYLEETGKIPPVRRTATGKRFFLPVDLKRIEKKLEKIGGQNGNH